MPLLIRHDLHKYSFKVAVFTDIRCQMIDVGVSFAKESSVCGYEIHHRYRIGFGNVEFRCEYLRESIDKEGLTRSLFMEAFNNLWREGLPSFIGILREEFLVPGSA